MEYSEFVKQVTHSGPGNQAKIRNSFGVYDAYKLARKNGWYDIGRPLKEHEFYAVVRGVNNMFAQELSMGNTVVLPERMGKLELRKHEVGVSIVDGKLKNTYPVNWDETVRLWYEDEEARKNKTLLRIENKYVYKVGYNKRDALYNNKTFYRFSLNRKIKRTLKKNIEQGKTDALW